MGKYNSRSTFSGWVYTEVVGAGEWRELLVAGLCGDGTDFQEYEEFSFLREPIFPPLKTNQLKNLDINEKPWGQKFSHK